MDSNERTLCLLDQPLFLRLFGLANVVLRTSDRDQPVMVIPAIPNAAELREQLRTSVEARRDKKRVRELDVDESVTQPQPRK